MKLFQIQDDDRPMFVIAETWGEALDKWKMVVGSENSVSLNEIEEPDGIKFIAEDNDIIV